VLLTLYLIARLIIPAMFLNATLDRRRRGQTLRARRATT